MSESSHSNEVGRGAIWPIICLIFGVGCLLLLAGCVASVWFGAASMDGTDQQDDFSAMKRSVAFSGLVIPLALLGSVFTILGLLFRKPGSSNKFKDTMACQNCGRQNATTTKICPRCETKLG